MLVTPQRKVLVGIALGASLLINGLQARYIYVLTRSADQAESSRKGLRLTSFEVTDQAGSRTALSFRGNSKPTLLYVFRPGCVWCQRNAQAAGAFFKAVSSRYRVIGLSLDSDGLKEFVAGQGISFPVYTVLLAAALRTYRLGSTPETLVISTAGKIEGDWSGAYTADTKRSMESYFGVSVQDAVQSTD
ncbi:MAG TPA: redoxin domain-containing protein [Bryobacteraceae bacterium]|jgi:peroxiredoxin|nr:redoxin domain-containing protein [Bryobacteraceae bacterium]